MLPREEYIALLSLKYTPNLGDQTIRYLLSHFGSAQGVIAASKKDLLALRYIADSTIDMIQNHRDTVRAKNVWQECRDREVGLLSINEPDYPLRLKQIDDAPVVLFYKGSPTWNPERALAIVGTRKITPHGRIQLGKIMEGLAGHDIQIISGLAIGTDGLAHKIAVESGMETIGVLANGLAHIYPDSHRDLAQKMTQHGGLVSELDPSTRAETYYFPMRNRIIAGMSDAVLVVESGHKGGSMITAKLAFSFNRDVFAIPGRPADYYSQGCLYLIQSNQAYLCTSGQDIITAMSWDTPIKIDSQTSLYPDLTEEEKFILSQFETESELHFQSLFGKSKMASSQLLSTLLSLELKGLVKSGPGQMYYRT